MADKKKASSLKGYGEGEEAEFGRKSAREILRALVGMKPYEETNPTEAYRIASTMTPLTMVGGGIKKLSNMDETARAIGKAAEAAGMKAPTTAAKSLTTLDDFHASLGDEIRRRSADMQNLIESTPFKYGIGDRVFTADSARKNRPPLEILNRVMVGNDPMREGHPILGKVIKDPETGKTKRTPYEPGYEVMLFEDKDNWTKFRIPESAIKGMIDPTDPLEKKDGGEVSTEEFIKKNVSRGTSEVPQLDAEGRLIDEREEVRSESQRMLNRLQSKPSKVPPGIRRAVAATKTQGDESMFPAAAPARDLLSGILGASPTAQGSEAYRTGQALANMPPVQAAAAIPAKIAASAGDAATALAAMGPAVGAVMKPKGGNWLTPSVERGLNYLIPRTGAANRTAKETLEEMNRTYPAEELAKMSPETRASVDRAYQWLEPNVAVQNWIEKKLTKYVKNEMATPEDPVRALAERGILHVDPEQLSSYPGSGNPTNQAVARRSLSYPEEGLAKSEAAKRWETASDYMIQTDRALNLLNPKEYGQGFVDQTVAANPWLTKIDPYERIYGVDTLNYRPDYSELGFDHLIDELKNSLNPNSGLPRALQLTPKQLDKVSMPQAVELVDKINKWRVENIKKLQLEETLKADLYKAYPEQDYRWVQLNRPGQFAAESDAMGHSVRGYEPPDKGGSDYYGLGGFKAIESGEAKVYSLRDEKGQPHVTIEVSAAPGAMTPSEFYHSDLATQSLFDRLDKVDEATIKKNKSSWWEEVVRESPEYQEYIKTIPAKITQIKGKGNEAPAKKYWAFAQDFVKSSNWSDVQDLKNIGLRKTSSVFNEADIAKLKDMGEEVPNYVSGRDILRLQDLVIPEGKRLKYDDAGHIIGYQDERFTRYLGFNKGGPVDVPRETSESQKQLEALKAPEVTGMNRVVDFIAQKLNPEWFATSGRTLLETAQGTRTPITEKNFKPEELDVIRRLVDLKGKDKGSVSYADYIELSRQMAKAKGEPLPTSVTPSLFSMADPLGNIQTTLGRFSYQTDPKGNLQIIDRYDFNPPMQQDMREARTGDYGAFGPYGMIREYAGEKIPSGSSAGRDVRINLGPRKK